MASVFKRKGDKGWTIAWFDHEGNRQEKASGTTDKKLAERIAASTSDRELERQRGLVDPAAERLAVERARPLTEHFDDYAAHLDSLQRGARHVEGTTGYLRKMAEALGWKTLAQIDAHALTTYLSERAEQRGTGARTFNAAVTAWRGFCRWCLRAHRLGANPLAGIGTRNVEADRRHVRRDISIEELARIIEVAERSPVVTAQKFVRDAKGERRTIPIRLTCPDRAWAYRIAAGTGFRVGEICSLTPESFDLDGEVPTIVVEAARSKHRRRDVQQIRADLAALLRPWLARKPLGRPVCPMPQGRAATLLLADMAAARAIWLNEAKTAAERAARERSDFLRHRDASGRVADFHGLRVHFVSRVVEAGATVKEAMELARHSDPRLTMKTYARVGMHSLGRVLNRMPTTHAGPSQETQILAATGTDAVVVSPENRCPQKSPHSSRGLGRVSAAGRDDDPRAAESPHDRKSLQISGLRDSARNTAASHENAGGKTRTFNLLIRSQMLYPIELRPHWEGFRPPDPLA